MSWYDPYYPCHDCDLLHEACEMDVIDERRTLIAACGLCITERRLTHQPTIIRRDVEVREIAEEVWVPW